VKLVGRPGHGVVVAPGSVGNRRREAPEQVLEARTHGARIELPALVLGQALCAPEPVGVQQRRRPAGPADRQSAAQVQLDEAVADAQLAERLELRCRVQGRRGLDLLGGGQD